METVTLVVFTVFTMGMGMARGARTGHHHLFSSSSRVGSFRHVVLGHWAKNVTRIKKKGRRKWDCGMCGDGLFFSHFLSLTAVDVTQEQEEEGWGK